MLKILLVEPSYKNKYPPLALMKISTYHKQLGDDVFFCKGKSDELSSTIWDRVYISTLFTFHWDIVIDTIKYYEKSVNHISDIFCGGVLATVLFDELKEKCNVTIISGLLDKPGILGDDELIIDTLPPDYSIIDTSTNPYLDCDYSIKDSYIAYATRGCIRECSFCAVPTIEPCFSHYIDIKKQVNYIKQNYGEKKHLLLLDNNVLASKDFDMIIDDIIELGFGKGATIKTKKNGRTSVSKRSVDFNQGIDARLLSKEKCLRLSEIAIKPLRIAFDDANPKTISLYKEKALLAAECGIDHLSNYILFNYNDTPEDFYNRLEINVQLNEDFANNGYKTRIWSFPMKYSPIKGENSKNRKYIGKNWNKKYLRAIHCILNATRGVVGPKKTFFHIAFGKDLESYFNILAMPEKYIINRNHYEQEGLTSTWRESFNRIPKDSELFNYIMNGDLKNMPPDYAETLHFYK